MTKYCKLLLVGGIVLALAMPAQAISFSQPWNGPVVMHVHNVAMGATYTGQLNPVGGGATIAAYSGSAWYNFATSAYDLAASPLYTPAQAVANAATGAKVGEDGWGLVQIDTIYAGQDNGYNNIGQLGVKLWETGPVGVGTELVATYFNRQDLGVQFLSTDYAHQTFEYHNDTFEIVEQISGTAGANLGLAGSGGRVTIGGVLKDKYVGIGYDAAGNLLSGATVVMSGVGEIGYFGSLANTTGIADFTVIGNTGSGSADQFYSVTGGTEMLFWDTNFFTPTKGLDYPADLRIHVTDAPIDYLKVPASYDWLTTSSDPLTGAHVPEPVTMAGLLLGIGCLGRYIRKRG